MEKNITDSEKNTKNNNTKKNTKIVMTYHSQERKYAK